MRIVLLLTLAFPVVLSSVPGANPLHLASGPLSRPAAPAAAYPLLPDQKPLIVRGEFDPGHGGAYGLALNENATRLYVVGESGWLDILDLSDPSAIQSIARVQFEDMPFGEDGKFGICYDAYFQRVAVGGGTAEWLDSPSEPVNPTDPPAGTPMVAVTPSRESPNQRSRQNREQSPPL